jgi:hypothetical protein
MAPRRPAVPRFGRAASRLECHAAQPQRIRDHRDR